MNSREDLRRALGWALVAGLSIAALTAIVAIVNGDFDETDARVIGTGLGFSVCSATGASGANLRFRADEGLRLLGGATALLSGIAFLFLTGAIWNEDLSGDSDWLWRGFGISGVLGLAGSHASLMLGTRRETDSDAVRLLTLSAVSLGAFDSFVGALAIAEVLEDLDEGAAQFMGVLLVLLVLATVLAPIVRRLDQRAPVAATPSRPESAARTPGTQGTPTSVAFAAEVIAVADRIEELNASPGSQAPAIRRECARLRDLARSHSR